MSEPALLERDGELRAIEAALDAAAAGRGGLVLIEGPAGIGKSALVARARAAAVERNIAVAHARGSELERADPFGVVRQLLEPRLRAMTAAERERALEGAAGFKADRLDAASRMTEAAVTRARRNGSAGGFAIASAWRAWIALRRGDGEAAEAHARAAVDGAPADGVAARGAPCGPRRGAGRAGGVRRRRAVSTLGARMDAVPGSTSARTS